MDGNEVIFMKLGGDPCFEAGKGPRPVGLLEVELFSFNSLGRF